SKNVNLPGGSAKCFIVNNDIAGSLDFKLSDFSAGEADGTATITVTRSGGDASGVMINYATGNGTAIAGADYSTVSGALEFGFKETTKTFTVPIIDNTTDDEDNKTVTLTLSNPQGRAGLGSQATATLTIKDNDVAGNLQFSASNYEVSEDGKSVTITVMRAGGEAS